MKNTNEIKDFQIYLHEARNKFVTDICKHKWDNEIRRSAEDFLITHDQLADRYFKMLSGRTSLLEYAHPDLKDNFNRDFASNGE